MVVHLVKGQAVSEEYPVSEEYTDSSKIDENDCRGDSDGPVTDNVKWARETQGSCHTTSTGRVRRTFHKEAFETMNYQIDNRTVFLRA